MGAKIETFMGLAGIGDVVLSCTSDLSRNRRLGLGLGNGQNMEEVVARIGQVVESARNVEKLYQLGKNQGVDMPITEEVYQILCHKKNPKMSIQNLLARKPQI
jgi:glycerol-3-phosphate dehydrogenase (NAD(P)+)